MPKGCVIVMQVQANSSSSRIGWYVIPILNSSKRLAGPYNSLTECERVAFNMQASETRQRIIEAILEGTSLPSHNAVYTPTPVRIAVQAPSTSTSPELSVQTDSGVSFGSRTYVPSRLLTKLRALPKSKLLSIAAAVNLSMPDDGKNLHREVLALRVYKALQELRTNETA